MGFSFIELMMALAIMGVLASIAVPMTQVVHRRAQEHALRLALIQLRAAIDDYKHAAEQGHIQLRLGETGYPPSLQALVDGVVDQMSATHQHMYFIRRIPADPFDEGAHTDPAASWGLRSYDSPPEDPRAGADVYDVYSRSTGVGLDGVPYRRW